MNNLKKEKSCGCIIIENDKVLLIQQTKGHWGFPKGHVEAFETESETAIREVKEELGYTDIKFDYTGVSEDIVDKLKVHQVTINYKGIFEKEILDNEFTSIESDWIRFKWFNIDELDNIEIHPKNIVNMIKNETNHIIEKIDM